MADSSFDVAASVLNSLERQDTACHVQSLSATMVEACSRASDQLKVLKLNSQERKVVGHVLNVDAAEGFVTQYVEAYQKTGSAKKGWKKVATVARLAKPVLSVFQQANFSPECSVALGLIGLLLVQPLNTRSEIEERLEHEMGQLADILGQARFSRSMIDSVQIETEIDGLCASIIDFLIHALQYQKKWGLVKILGAIVHDFKTRFQSFVDKIKHHAAKIERLAQQGYTTILVDSKDLLEATASTTNELRKWAIAHQTNFNCKVARLETSVMHFQQSITELRTYEALKYVNEIDAILSPASLEPKSAPLCIRERMQDLAPKEQWQNFASEIQFPDWLHESKPPILWIGGTINKRGACWVSSLAMDIIEALEAERGIDLAYVLCDHGGNFPPFSPLAIFKTALVQLLKTRPEIVFQRPFMDLLPLQMLTEASKSTNVAFVALASLIKIFGEQTLSDGREVFLIVDRIDCCAAMESESEGRRFLQSLRKLNELNAQLRIIVTSSTPAPELPAFEKGRQNFAEVWINPHKPIAMYSR